MTTDPQAAAPAHRWEGYNDKPVEARLGPHRYLIPANYFDNQIGPEFDGSFSLKLQWPDLQPLPPGERSKQSMETFNKQISILPNYVDRVPIDAVLERATRSIAAQDSLESQDPRDRLDLMDAADPVFGLTPYRVNQQRLTEHLEREKSLYGVPSKSDPRFYKDWYVARDDSGRIRTLIRCTPQALADGLVVEGTRVTAQESAEVAQCTHEFVIDTDKISVSISYARIFLKDWKAIEDRARQLLEQHRVK